MFAQKKQGSHASLQQSFTFGSTPCLSTSPNHVGPTMVCCQSSLCLWREKHLSQLTTNNVWLPVCAITSKLWNDCCCEDWLMLGPKSRAARTNEEQRWRKDLGRPQRQLLTTSGRCCYVRRYSCMPSLARDMLAAFTAKG